MNNMNSDYLPVTVGEYSPDVPDLSEYSGRVMRLVDASVASETRRAYFSRLRRLINWSKIKGFSSEFPVSPEVLASYIADMAEEGYRYSTIEQTMAAISISHKAQGLTSPTESLLVKKPQRL